MVIVGHDAETVAARHFHAEGRMLSKCDEIDGPDVDLEANIGERLRHPFLGRRLLPAETFDGNQLAQIAQQRVSIDGIEQPGFGLPPLV